MSTDLITAPTATNTSEPPSSPRVTGGSKVAWHGERLDEYLSGRRIFPVTLELDLTSQCTRDCPDCPSTRAPFHHYLDQAFVDRLLGLLGGHTTGLLLTGGEPTMAPLFASTLRSARDRGFVEIAVVTNGTLLDEDRVAGALLEHASTIRLSMYDWDGGACEGPQATLARVERLRNRIERSGSGLRIGISALTSAARVPLLENLATDVRTAGAHWLYFHPMCTGWGSGAPKPVAQDGVIAEVERLQATLSNHFEVHLPIDRYVDDPLGFAEYHSAHFLLIVGADGKNYLGPEVKYQPRHEVADFRAGWDDDVLWRPERLARLRATASGGYPALGSRHRSVLYCDFIERLRDERQDARAARSAARQRPFRFPHIL